jgi:AraC-like DNA-binding protein
MPVHKDRYRRPQHCEPATRVRPVFDDFHLLRMEGDYEYPLHQHTNYEVILVERGPYRCMLNQVELVVPNGQALLIKPGDWHQDHLYDGQRHYVLHFRLLAPEAGRPPNRLFRDGVSPDEQICRDDYAQGAWIMGELRSESEAGAPYAGAVQDSLLEALFWKLVRSLPPNSLDEAFRQLPKMEARRELIATAFEKHLTANPSVRDLAKALNISPRLLVNQSRELFGQPPARLLLSMKLRRAEELLRVRHLRVAEVSDLLGFSNPYHFSRVYKRFYGRPPSPRS